MIKGNQVHILVRKEIIGLELCGFNMANNEFREELDPQSSVNKVIGIVSGKGGVGKSLVTSLMAVKAMSKGYRVGIIDADITGPSIPKAFGLSGKLGVTYDELMIPAVTNTGINVVSTNLILENETDPVIWRGPVIAGVVKQFWKDTVWNNIDYMFVDMPPGTGDAQLTLAQSVPVTAGVCVTTPQTVALDDSARGLDMFEKLHIPIAGLIENMSGFICPDNGKEYDIFGRGGAQKLAQRYNTEVIGEIPIEIAIREGGDSGKPVSFYAPDSLSAKRYEDAARKLWEKIEKIDREELADNSAIQPVMDGKSACSN